MCCIISIILNPSLLPLIPSYLHLLVMSFLFQNDGEAEVKDTTFNLKEYMDHRESFGVNLVRLLCILAFVEYVIDVTI